MNHAKLVAQLEEARRRRAAAAPLIGPPNRHARRERAARILRKERRLERALKRVKNEQK